MNESKEKIVIGMKGVISSEELNRKVNEGNIYLLDIRKIEDFNNLKIEGSVHSEWESVADLIEDDLLPKDKTIVVVCYNGQSSMQVSTVLNIQGYKALSLLDGMEGWQELGLKVK